MGIHDVFTLLLHLPTDRVRARDNGSVVPRTALDREEERETLGRRPKAADQVALPGGNELEL